MTMTYTIDHIPATSHDISVPDNESPLGLQGPDPASSKDEVSSKYVSLLGDPAYLATVTYRVSDVKRGGNPVKRIAITRTNWVVATDSETGIVTRKQITYNFGINVPADITVEAADVTTGFLDAVSYVIPGTGDVFAHIAKMLFGITAVR